MALSDGITMPLVSRELPVLVLSVVPFLTSAVTPLHQLLKETLSPGRNGPTLGSMPFLLGAHFLKTLR